MTQQIGTFLVAGIIAYLLGSISTGILVSRAGHGPDLRKVGSKSTGASNVQRTMGWKWGLITFTGDFLKAVLACWIGKILIGNQMGTLFCGLAVVIGHNWPVFFQMKGGKGVASSCGVMLFCFPVPALICFIFTITLIAITKYISLGSMSMLTLYALLVSFFFSGGDWRIIAWCIILAILCIYRHRANIQRLLKGEENKIGQKVKS